MFQSDTDVEMPHLVDSDSDVDYGVVAAVNAIVPAGNAIVPAIVPAVNAIVPAVNAIVPAVNAIVPVDDHKSKYKKLCSLYGVPHNSYHACDTTTTTTTTTTHDY